MEKDQILLLTKEDLNLQSRDLKTEDIQYHHFSTKYEQQVIHKHHLIMYVDDNGFVKILKNRGVGDVLSEDLDLTKFNLEIFKNYVATYEDRDYIPKTMLEDMLYGLAISINIHEHKMPDGYAKFKARLLRYLWKSI